MGRKRDHFWDHADDLNGRFKCIYCKREFPGGASRIKSHLAGVKGRDIDICDVVPDDVQKEAYEAIAGRSKKQKGESTSSSAKEGTITLTSISKDDTSSGAKERKRDHFWERKRDPFWDHADDLNGRFKCIYCKRVFPGGASRIKSHLAGVKGRDIVICEVVPDDVQKEAYEAIVGRSKKQKGESTSSSAKEGTITLTSISKDDILHRSVSTSSGAKESKISSSGAKESTITSSGAKESTITSSSALESTITSTAISKITEDKIVTQSTVEYMGRRRDQFWQYAEKRNRRFKCNFCDCEFPGGASRIKSHLAGVKGRNIAICDYVPENVRANAYEATEGTNKKRKSTSTSSRDESKIHPTSILRDNICRVFEKSTEEYKAEVGLSVIVEGLLAKLRSIITKRMSFEWDFSEGLIELLVSLSQIQLVLNDAEKRQVNDGCVRMWLTNFGDVAYDIDDALDEFGYYILQQKVQTPNQMKEKVCNSYSLSNHIVFPFNMANKIKTINKSLNGLKDEIASFDLRVEFVNSILEIILKKEIDSFLDDPENVAQIMETPPQYELKELSESDCWSLFKKRAFANKRLLPQELVKIGIGMEIAKKCRRVPWALRVLGGTMYFEHDISEWLSIQKNKIWDLLDDDNNGVFRVLKLSFDHLPTPSLKRCFAYCAIFPKDYEMEKEKLIQHWMAVGFLEPSKESNMEMEDIGNMYFNILLATSFFQNARKDAYGNIIGCKMHDMVYDLALTISKSEALILEEDSMDDINHVRGLVVQSYGLMTPRISFTRDGSMKLHTLVSDNVDFGYMLSDFRCLRVLKLLGENELELPDSIGKLIHLRLLEINGPTIVKLPKSITKLYNLQTLIIKDCYSVELPKDLSNLINLRHIDIDSITETPKDIGRLTCLQTLPRFYVDEDEGRQIKELGCLNQLRGELDIYNLEYVRDKEEARSANLATKAKIYKLGFYWNDEEKRGNDSDNNDEEVLEGLQPHQNLKSLKIKCYQGKKFPSWMLTSRDPGVGLSLYDNLIEITLSYCTECEQVPTLGHLPCLRVLEIKSMGIYTIGTEFYSDGNYRNTLFPVLKRLKMNNMFCLEEWKDAEELTTGEGEVFPCLEELTIKDCEYLNSIPDLRGLHSLTQLVFMGCPELTLLLEGFLDCFTQLKTLQIFGLLGSAYFGCRCLNISLSSLQLNMSPNLKTLPDKIQRFTALKELHIEGFDVMEALPEWLGNFSSLQSLSLSKCKNLMDLSTVEAMRSLTKLDIVSCPKLKERYAKGSGAESSKIAHIQDITIDGEKSEDGFLPYIDIED